MANAPRMHARLVLLTIFCLAISAPLWAQAVPLTQYRANEVPRTVLFAAPAAPIVVVEGQPAFVPLCLMNPALPQLQPPAQAPNQRPIQGRQGTGAQTCGVTGQPQSTLNPTGPYPPYRFRLETMGGFPPFGMTLEPNTGFVSGIAKGVGQHSFQVCAVDVAGNVSNPCPVITITVVAPQQGQQQQGQAAPPGAALPQQQGVPPPPGQAAAAPPLERQAGAAEQGGNQGGSASAQPPPNPKKKKSAMGPVLGLLGGAAAGGLILGQVVKPKQQADCGYEPDMPSIFSPNYNAEFQQYLKDMSSWCKCNGFSGFSNGACR